MSTRNHTYFALGALNDALNALNLALGRAADLGIPLDIRARPCGSSEEDVKRWHVSVAERPNDDAAASSAAPAWAAGDSPKGWTQSSGN